VRVQNVQQNGTLVNILDVLNLLSDVLGSGTDTTNRQEDVVLQEVAGEHLNVSGEGGRKHEGLAVLDRGHVLTLDNTTNLGLETHVQHAISLVKNEVLDVLERNATTLYEIDKTTRGSNEQIATALDLAKLRTNVGTTVDDARADPGSVGKLARLIVDLGDQLTSGSQDQRSGVSLALTSVTTTSSGGSSRASLESLGQNREQETTSLSGTSLGTSHQITSTHDNGNGVLLDGSGHLVARERDVADQVIIQRRVGEGQDRLGNVMTGSLDGNVIVLLKVDTSVLLGRVVGSTEKLALNARVGRACNVLAVSPLTIARATGVAATATTSTRVAVSIAIEAGAVVIPAARTAAVLLLRSGREIGATGSATGGGTTPAAGCRTSVISVVTVLNKG
jgi:hypothetical protein